MLKQKLQYVATWTKFLANTIWLTIMPLLAVGRTGGEEGTENTEEVHPGCWSGGHQGGGGLDQGSAWGNGERRMFWNTFTYLVFWYHFPVKGTRALYRTQKLEQEIYEMSLEHLVAPENREVLNKYKKPHKYGWKNVESKNTSPSCALFCWSSLLWASWQRSQWSKLGQLEQENEVGLHSNPKYKINIHESMMI